MRLGTLWTEGQVGRQSEFRYSGGQEISKRNTLGIGGYELIPSSVGEAINCSRQLNGTGPTLLEAVRMSLKNYRPQTNSIPSPMLCLAV